MNIFQNLLDEQKTETIPPDDFQGNGEYISRTERKTDEEIRKLKIGNEKELNNLIERKMAQAMIEEMGHSIQTTLVDFARRESPVIAALLGIPHLERDLEKLLSDKIHIAIESVKGTCVKLASDRLFE